MSAPISNRNGCGKAGRSGRKSYIDERATYQFFVDLWFTEYDKREIDNKIKSNRFSPRDMLLKLIFDGNDKVLIAVLDKVFPDSAMGRQYEQHNHYGKVQTQELTSEEKAELADMIERAFENNEKRDVVSNLRVTVQQLLAPRR